MLPFGSNGELAAMLRTLGVPHRIHDAEVFASFHVRGRQYVCRSLLQLCGVLGPRQFAQLCRLGIEMLALGPRPEERAGTFRDWLERRITRAAAPELYAYFERMCHFALSVDLDKIAYPEVVEITKNMLRYGAPGIVDGGCAALTGELERRIRADGGELRMEHDVLALAHTEGRVTGVRVRDRATGDELLLRAPMVISNIGPEATQRLTAADLTPGPSPTGRGEAEADLAHGHSEEVGRRREASGLKVHLLSDVSIIPHQGIMYCLDTERIAGIVQPSNSDRRLAPPGKHLLITHQLMRSDDVNAEREAARADLRRLFGEDFGTRVNVLTMSQYRGEWPVNRLAQGEDLAPETDLVGLYQVGDAVKPSGYLMVEGVAQSVNALLDALERLDRVERGDRVPAPGGETLDAASRPGLAAGALGAASSRHTSHTPPKPGRHRALRWLVAPPPPHPDSSRPIQIPLPGAPRRAEPAAEAQAAASERSRARRERQVS